MSDIVEKLRNHANGLWEVHPLGRYGICDEAAETIIALRKAYEAAVAFIDSHVADPDITGEMVQAYAEYQRTRAALSTTEAK